MIVYDDFGYMLRLRLILQHCNANSDDRVAITPSDASEDPYPCNAITPDAEEYCIAVR